MDEMTNMDAAQYNAYIEQMRQTEYPMLKDATYLDHAGTTLYSKSLLEAFSADMMSNLYGNPHSASQASQRSTHQVQDVRLQLLRYFDANPDDFDLIFVANATAGIKLVADALREHESGFWYGYHRDAHTSLVGVRELAKEHRCFAEDKDVEEWIRQNGQTMHNRLGLLAYPAQSNMNGRRLPLGWCEKMRSQGVLTLLDAAALLSTSPLSLANLDTAPDFTVLSLYKIFGFPDLGALIVRKDAAWALQKRRYFGGGTVDMVVSLKEQWHAVKSAHLHEQFEDGTLPIHSIIALKSALSTHTDLFGTLNRISEHTSHLAERLYTSLLSLRHGNDEPVCQIYKDPLSTYGDGSTQGPVIAFNLRDARGQWISNLEVEKLAHVRNINIRTGGLCNPGGIQSALHLSPWQMKQNFSSGQRCGSENDDVINGQPTGMIRASLGAMSTLKDVETFISFITEFFLDSKSSPNNRTDSPVLMAEVPIVEQLHIESLTVYPVKSCAGWQIPPDTSWEVRPQGLIWDREWCIIHSGTSAALSQKKYPRMALLRPSLDFAAGLLHITCAVPIKGATCTEITVPLSADPRCFLPSSKTSTPTNVCGDNVSAKIYSDPSISSFLSSILDVPCQLARLPANSTSRHMKPHLRTAGSEKMPLSFSNESPVLCITRMSVNALNKEIKAKGGIATPASTFRANIVISQPLHLPPGTELPHAEDSWSSVSIAKRDTEAEAAEATFDVLGKCRRCHMLCIDQRTAEKRQEPFVTLAKTRRSEGKVWFGVHLALGKGQTRGWLRVGDAVVTS
ncbi:molybdenum cofactor sulfurase protein-like protein [Aureobasidium subglaciale]|nr:molybdenum cofactor sulfurase protein-like protein [Aureobasidium subglaciale]KAI5215447.1 molybdenum cofactor sulfurase protein-like protein [Aureobasidium subglaciale]KAI5217998.1 molybdenum cofactor sulfurase protein-like protein [Aureobasidium subglaciale]KAI5255612.1 molybdenum cofactor sulfurase protein-like protein [Aureobasidium subglaciale]